MPLRTNSNHSTIRERAFFSPFGWVLCVLLLFFSSHAEQLPVKTYTVADGLLRDRVYRIKQDSRGFMWFCTAEGITRFDGMGMTNFTVADGLPHQDVNDFLETATGTIYIATAKGLARLNPHGLRGSIQNPLFTVFLPENPKAEKIVTLFEDKNHQVWVGTSDGLYKLIETGERISFEPVTLGKSLGHGGAIAEPDPQSLYVNTILEDRNGTFWIGTYGGGLFRLSPNGEIRRYTGDDKLGDNKITDLLETRDGQLWVSLRSDESGGICLLDPQTDENPVKKCYRSEDGLGSNWIRDMVETNDGQLWLATIPGLCRFQGKNDRTPVCKTYTAKNNLCDNIRALAEDQDGNLWVGSPCGTKKIARYGFTTYQVPEGEDYEYHIKSVFEDSEGHLLASTFRADNRVGRLEGDKFSLVKPRFPAWVDYHGWGWEQTVWHDSRGAWWFPTGYGLFRSPDHTKFEDLATAPLEKVKLEIDPNLVKLTKDDMEIFRVFEDSRSDIWVITTGIANQLLRWERSTQTWHNYSLQAGFSSARVGSAFVEDHSRNVWIGATSDHKDSALIRFRNGEFRVLTEAEGAPSGWIQDLFVDSRGRLWVASADDGVWRLDDPNADFFEFIKYTPANGLTSMAAACINEDEFGRIYIGTWRGIDRLTPDTGQVENFTTADGLPGSFVESAYRDHRNHLWFTTERGLVQFIPEPPRQRQPPTILITGLRVNNEQQRVSIMGETLIEPLDLQADQRQITVDVLGLGASLGEKLKYEYRFGDQDWITTNERTLNFANLAAGDYRLEIRVQTADRIYSQNPAVVSFKIAPPLWQRWWFLSLISLSLAIFVYLIYKYRVQRLLELEKTRTRIATDLHDDIGSNLTKISIMSEVARRIEGNKQSEILNSIADISRSSVSSMSDIVWAINPNKDSFLDLVRRMREHAEEILGQRDILVDFVTLRTSVEIKLDADVRRNVYLIFKESLNNIVRHSQATKVIIDLGVLKNHLVLKINDNGKGFDAARNYDGNGLLNIKRRVQSLNGRLQIDSNGKDGTRIILEVPVENTFWN